MTTEKKCCYCPKTTELRPYGPKGAWVCFECAFSTPERTAETDKNAMAMLEAAANAAGKGGAVMVDDEHGFIPLAKPGSLN